MPLTKIDTGAIKDNAINSAKIADGTVVASDVLDNTITGAKLATDIAITTSGNITTTGAFTSTGIDDNATSTAITIDSSENVGIGETAPLGKVHIKQNDSGVTSAPTFADALFIEDSSNTGITICTPTNGIGSIAFGDSGDNDIGKFQYQHSDNSMLFVANAAERMRIDSSGNVGIGTSSPAHNLEIVTTASGSINDSLQIRNNATASGTGSRIRFINSTDQNSDTNGASIASIRTGDDNVLVFETENAERMRINHLGNVGIGTSSPSSKLSIYSSDTTVYSASSVGGQDSGSTLKIQNISNAVDVFASIDFNTNNNRVVNRIVSSHGNSTVDGFLSFITEGGGTPAERMRIDSSGNVGIGTSSASSLDSEANNLVVGSGSGDEGITIYTGTNVGDHGSIFFADGTVSPATKKGQIRYEQNNEVMSFFTNASERMRITSGGDLLVGKTATGIGTAGNEFKSYGEVYVTRNNQNLGLFNRLNGDGQLFGFMHDSITEGTISVSGATVSYNGFTGSHWSRFIDESKPDVLRGTVLESLDEMTDWYHAEFETSYTEKDADGNDVVKTTTQKKPYALKDNEQEGDVITYNWNTEKKDEEGNDIIEQVQATIVKQLDVKHVMSKISDTVEAKNVYGVFSAWDNDDLINNDFYVASVGSFVVRIKAGQVVAKGDLLQSNGDGTAKVQADDIIRASTFAKVLSNTVIETYEDGSFIIPCSLMC
jgi:hypothetical protein